MKKKAAAAAIAIVAAAVVFFGGGNGSLRAENSESSTAAESQEATTAAENGQTENSQTGADGQTADSSQTAADSEAQANPDLPVIDTSISVMPGARIAVVSKQTKGQYWSLIKDGMEQAVKDINEAYGFSGDDAISMTFEGASDESDVESQINTLDAVIAENPSVVCISAGDEDSCQAQLEAAKENGIPVVTFDSNVSASDMIWEFLGTDNQKIGELGAEKLAAAIGESGQIAVFSPQEKTQSARERTEAFVGYIEQNYPNIEIVQTLYADKVDDLEAAMQGVLDIYPDLAGVFCSNAEVAEMYLNHEKPEEKETSIALVGVDATDTQQEAMKDGREAGVVSQQPYALGYQTLWAAAQSTFQGNTAQEKNHLMEPVWIDANNLDDAAYANYIY